MVVKLLLLLKSLRYMHDESTLTYLPAAAGAAAAAGCVGR
jgi:hypothetical protein